MTAKFHLDDDASRGGGFFYCGVGDDTDGMRRPWRFAHRNPMPASITLFPKIEAAAARFRETCSVIKWRLHCVKAGIKGEIGDYE